MVHGCQQRNYLIYAQRPNSQSLCLIRIIIYTHVKRSSFSISHLWFLHKRQHKYRSLTPLFASTKGEICYLAAKSREVVKNCYWFGKLCLSPIFTISRSFRVMALGTCLKVALATNTSTANENTKWLNSMKWSREVSPANLVKRISKEFHFVSNFQLFGLHSKQKLA